MDIWSRSRHLLGEENLHKLAQARVAVIGTGGVGSFAVEALARSGVGFLFLMDPDVVSSPDINRQLPALRSTQGRPKVEVLAQRCRDINPALEVVPCQERYSREKRELVPQRLDFLIDAVDEIEAKVDLILMARERDLAMASSMGMGRRLDPTCVRLGSLQEVKGCPLAREIKRRLRQMGIEPRIQVVYSLELPQDLPSPGAVGSMIFVPATAGLFLAYAALKGILDKT
ncbi:MAG TPA: tRNA threonylcarbamoyladenosine dehydratase [Moorella mulderi]|nr:tRNA threonylcarbamoyladenosine dehydratase [Moorella mulderi]